MNGLAGYTAIIWYTAFHGKIGVTTNTVFSRYPYTPQTNSTYRSSVTLLGNYNPLAPIALHVIVTLVETFALVVHPPSAQTSHQILAIRGGSRRHSQRKRTTHLKRVFVLIQVEIRTGGLSANRWSKRMKKRVCYFYVYHVRHYTDEFWQDQISTVITTVLTGDRFDLSTIFDYI